MTLLAGRYTLDVPLGDSDLGTVWNAHDASGTLLVVVTLEDDAPEALQARFRAHAKALVKTTHASLVRAIDEGDENGAPFLVLERVVGESLASRLENGPALTTGRVIDIAVALADALAVVHAAGFAHGDVEPGNVLLVGESGHEVPKLIGFALNRASVRQDLGERTSLPSIGPVAYAAPEQARGEVMDGALADQASLAALVYAALGGRPPHIARDVAALKTAIGSERAPQLTLARRELAPFASTIDRALSSDPKKRFADVGAFGRALKTAANMAKAIASSPVPLGARSAIGEPPAPSLPRAATIPKPAGALGAARPMPSVKGPTPGRKPTLMGVAIPRPGAAPAATSTRTTEELEIGDLLKPPGEQVPTAIVKPVEKAAPVLSPVRSTEELDVRGLIASDTGTVPLALVQAVDPLTPIRSTEEIDVAQLQAMAPAPPPAPPHAAAHPPPPPPAPPHAAAPPPPPPPLHAPVLVPPRDSAPELDAADLQSIPPPAPPRDGAHAAPPPPPTPPKTDEPDGAPTDVVPVVPAEEPLVSVSPSMEKIVVAATAAAQNELGKSPPPKAAAPALIDVAPSPMLDEDRPSLVGAGERPAWMVPAGIAAALLLVVVAWFGYRALRTPPTHETAGHTLTLTPPPTTTVAATTVPVTTVPETTVPVTTVPVTTVPATTVPPTSVAPPPSTIVRPPTTRVAPPPTTTTRPPTTGTRPPTTGTRPPTTGTRPPTTGTRPPTTGTRPPPTSTVRRPPPTTTTRPTVVSDPGF